MKIMKAVAMSNHVKDKNNLTQKEYKLKILRRTMKQQRKRLSVDRQILMDIARNYNNNNSRK